MSTYKVTQYKEDFVDGQGDEIEASSPKEAAEKYLQEEPDRIRYDGNEYEVFVRDQVVVKRFSVLCSVEITFDAEEVNDDE